MFAIVCLLFILGLFYVNSWHKWWIIAASVIGILLAWGNNFMAFNSFMLEYLPFYNKFRAPSMALVIPQICIPILAVLTLSKLVYETDYEAAFKKLRNGAIAAAAVLVLLGAFWAMADYTGKGDADIKKGFVENFSRGQNGQQDLAQGESLAKEIMTAIRSDRKSHAGGDLLRTFLFMVAAVALVAFVVKKKISPLVATVALTILSLVDIIGVDKRYLNYDDFKEKEEVIINISNDLSENTTTKADNNLVTVSKKRNIKNMCIFNLIINLIDKRFDINFLRQR